jgi:hypothetical protein
MLDLCALLNALVSFDIPARILLREGESYIKAPNCYQWLGKGDSRDFFHLACTLLERKYEVHVISDRSILATDNPYWVKVECYGAPADSPIEAWGLSKSDAACRALIAAARQQQEASHG